VVKSAGETVDALKHFAEFKIGELKFPETKIGEIATKLEDWVSKTSGAAASAPASSPPVPPKIPMPPPLKPRIILRRGGK
jgi:hypothetical protein